MDLRKIGALEELSEVQVSPPVAPFSLFVAVKGNTRFKKLDLEGLSQEQRAAKLHRWELENRFVAVVESCDQVFAGVHPHFIGKLGLEKDLSVNGKKVVVEALTDEEAESLAAIAKTYHEQALSRPGETTAEEVGETSAGSRHSAREYLATSSLLSDRVSAEYVRAGLQNELGNILLAGWKRWNEALVEERELKAVEEKRQGIKDTELKERIRQVEMQHENITR